MKFVVLFFLFFFSHLYAFEYTLSSSKVANAQTLFIKFQTQSDEKLIKVAVGKRVYSIFKLKSGEFYSYIPFSYYEKVGLKDIKVVYEKNHKKLHRLLKVEIVEGNYKKEHITVSKSKVNPKSKTVKKRTSKEYKEAMDIYGSVTQKSYVSSAYILPMHSKITSAFGTARVYNNELKGYHSGTDFRAKVGTPIYASNDGVVVLAKDRFYAGGSVLVDHGEGIYSCYYHMSKFDVKEGDKVKKNQKLGLSGKSGRVTGPHLHFSMRVGGLQVDPLQFIELVNREKYKEKR